MERGDCVFNRPVFGKLVGIVLSVSEAENKFVYLHLETNQISTYNISKEKSTLVFISFKTMLEQSEKDKKDENFSLIISLIRNILLLYDKKP